GADADQAVVADLAAVQHGHVPHRDPFADGQRLAGIRMQHRPVLDVAARADGDRVVVAAGHGPEPQAGPGAENHVSYDGRVGSYPVFAFRWKLWTLVTQPINIHHNLS